MQFKAIFGTAALAVAFGTVSAGAEEFKGEAVFGWFATGQTYMLEDRRPYFLGAFSGPQFFKNGAGPLHNSTLVCPGFNEIGVTAGGFCTVTVANGDKLFLKWTCDAIDTASGDLVTCAGRTTVTGGTGMFAKATGGNDLIGHIRTVHADGTSAGYSELKNYVLDY